MPPKSGFLARENRSPVDQKCSITTLIRDAAKVLSSKLIGTRLLSRLTLVHASRGAPRGTFRSSESSPTGRRAAIRVAGREAPQKKRGTPWKSRNRDNRRIGSPFLILSHCASSGFAGAEELDI